MDEEIKEHQAYLKQSEVTLGKFSYFKKYTILKIIIQYSEFLFLIKR